MQKHGRLEQKIELAEISGGRLGVCDVIDLREQVKDGAVRRLCAKNDLVATLGAKRNNVGVTKGVFGYFCAVEEEAAALAAVFENVTVVVSDGGRVTRNVSFGKLEMISTACAATD